MTDNKIIQWRQGHALSQDASNQLGLKYSDAPDKTLAIVVSHDCDLASDKESSLEVIVGKIIEKADGNCTHAKNARKLHLEFKSLEDAIYVELPADKVKLLKQELANYQPSNDIRLPPENRHVLQRWLAARYRRAAFPNAFNMKLQKTGLDNELTKILRAHGIFIPAIFFDLDSGEEIERKATDDLYVLIIIILHTTDDYEKAYAAAIKTKNQIEKAFREKLMNKNNSQWEYIELKDCFVMSDEALTYRQSTFLKQWRLEHMSLKENPAHQMMEQ